MVYINHFEEKEVYHHKGETMTAKHKEVWQMFCSKCGHIYPKEQRSNICSECGADAKSERKIVKV